MKKQIYPYLPGSKTPLIKVSLYIVHINFSFKCLAEDIKYEPLIQAANHEDFSDLYLRFGRKRNLLSRCILINAKKDIVMFMYDDRGCEVIAKNKEIIRDSYKKYKEWIQIMNEKV